MIKTLVFLCVLSNLVVSSAQGANGGSGAICRPSIGTPRLAYDGDSADVSILAVSGTYYAYSTNVTEQNVPVMTSNDLVHWRRLGDAMAFLPSWASDASGFTWAPSVASAPDGGYEAFYSTLDSNGQECIGRATAPNPTGPFLDASPTPLVCSAHQGAIDPWLFRSAAGDFLIWKADTGRGKPSQILAQQLSGTDSQLVGAPAVLLTADHAWEAGIVEGPSLADVGGRLYLFFSANRWDTNAYAIGVTSCASPLGPCDDSNASVAVSSGPGMAGPGGPDVFSGQGHQYLAFSAWRGGAPRTKDSRRALYVSHLGGIGLGHTRQEASHSAR